MLVLLGAALVLLLVVACSSDDNDGGTPGNIAELLSAVGGPEAAQSLRSGSGVNTGIWVGGWRPAPSTPPSRSSKPTT